MVVVKNNTKVPVKENENGEAEKFDPVNLQIRMSPSKLQKNNANIQSLLKKREKEELAMGGLGQLPIVEGLELIEEFNVGASASGSKPDVYIFDKPLDGLDFNFRTFYID
ncbi:hypothetical protein Tco_0462312 [Tanacetum coccineum]